MSFFDDIEQSWPNVMDTRMRIRRQLWKEDMGRDRGKRKMQPTEVGRKRQGTKRIVFRQNSWVKIGSYQQYLGHGFEILGVVDFLAHPKLA